jgi:thiamine-monophosphate kinase
MSRARGEFELIARYFAPLARGAPGAWGLSDDAALLDLPAEDSLILTLDSCVAGVHFLEADPPESVARKILRVNLSDLAAMGARPLGYLLSTALTKGIDEAWLAGFSAGLEADQRAFGLSLLGGDTVATPGPITLSLAAFGAVPKGRALRRTTGRAGDLLFLSGTLGDAALGLRVAKGELGGLEAGARDYLVGRYRVPEPRLGLGRALLERGLASAAIDVSDGLAADLGHLAAGAGLQAEVALARLPFSAPAREALAARPELLPALVSGGDDYELLFAAPPEARAALAALAGELELPLSEIGALGPGAGVRILDARGRPLEAGTGGWQHF